MFGDITMNLRHRDIQRTRLKSGRYTDRKRKREDKNKGEEINGRKRWRFEQRNCYIDKMYPENDSERHSEGE